MVPRLHAVGATFYVHDGVAHLTEKGSLQWLGEVICHHVSGGTVLYTYLVVGNPIGNEELLDVDVPGAFAA